MREKIINDFQNNPTQWMLQHDCKTERDVLMKMMELYAKLKNYEKV